MNRESDEDVLSLIPHRPPFVLVERLVSAGEDSFVTEFEIRPGNILVRDGLFSEAGMLENIAQSAALGFGYAGKKHGQEPKIGYIGAISRVEVFTLPRVGDRMTTYVKVMHRLDPVVMVYGTCYRGEEKLLEGEIKLVI